jgi:hypothetical protein
MGWAPFNVLAAVSVLHGMKLHVLFIIVYAIAIVILVRKVLLEERMDNTYITTKLRAGCKYASWTLLLDFSFKMVTPTPLAKLVATD